MKHLPALHATHRPVKLGAGGVLALALTAISWAGGSEFAHATNAGAPTASNASSPDKSWQLLSPLERGVLAPLASQWPSMNDSVREKWRSVARGYPALSPDAQARVRERMNDWSQTSSKERGEARLRFQNARQVPAQERQQKWEAYQALSPEAKADLAQQAQRKQQAMPMAATETGPRESGQNGKPPASGSATHKANVVPNPGQPTSKVVAPAVVKSGPGATTSLMTQSAPRPPLHQQTGLPKIAATKTFVDPQTLLPKKGSQGAAMTPVGARASAAAPASDSGNKR